MLGRSARFKHIHYTRKIFNKIGIPKGKGEFDIATQEKVDRSRMKRPAIYIDLENWIGHNASLKSLIRNKEYRQAISFFESLRDHGPIPPNNLTFDMIFSVFEKVGSPWDVVNNFLHLRATGLTPTPTNMAYLLKAYSILSDHQSALKEFEEYKNSGYQHLSRSYCIIADLLIEKGKLKEATKVLNEAHDLNLYYDIELYNSFIHLYHKSSSFDKAEEVYNKLIEDPEKRPNLTTYLRILRMFIKNNESEKIKSVLDHMLKREINVEFTNFKYSLLKEFSECGNPGIIEVLDQLSPPVKFVYDPVVKWFHKQIQAWISTGGDLQEALNSYADTFDRKLKVAKATQNGKFWTTDLDVLMGVFTFFFENLHQKFPKPNANLGDFAPMDENILEEEENDNQGDNQNDEDKASWGSNPFLREELRKLQKSNDSPTAGEYFEKITYTPPKRLVKLHGDAEIKEEDLDFVKREEKGIKKHITPIVKLEEKVQNDFTQLLNEPDTKQKDNLRKEMNENARVLRKKKAKQSVIQENLKKLMVSYPRIYKKIMLQYELNENEELVPKPLQETAVTIDKDDTVADAIIKSLAETNKFEVKLREEESKINPIDVLSATQKEELKRKQELEQKFERKKDLESKLSL